MNLVKRLSEELGGVELHTIYNADFKEESSDWRSFVPPVIASVWQQLPLTTKMAIRITIDHLVMEAESKLDGDSVSASEDE